MTVHLVQDSGQLSAGVELLLPNAAQRYWIRGYGAEVDIGDMGEVMGQVATEGKIAFPMSHNVLTSIEEYVQ